MDEQLRLCLLAGSNTAYQPADRLCWRGCVKVRDRDAYGLFVRVEPNRDVIWSSDTGDCGPRSSMAALPAGSACMMLPN